MDTDDVTKCLTCRADTQLLSDVLEDVVGDPQEMDGRWCPVCGTLQALDRYRRALIFVPKNAANAAAVTPA